MFEHVALLLSFVFALALTHLLSSTTEIILGRDRLRFSGLHAAWMVAAYLSLLVNWLSYWGLVALKHWTVGEVELWFAAATIQYFTCSLISIRPDPDGVIDMPAFFARQRPAIFTAFFALMAVSMIQNYADRNHTSGLGPSDWISENLLVLPMAVSVVIAGWTRTLWLQWVAVLVILGLIVFFLSTFALPA
ncbi:MAG TPA: hypothetical protein VII73_14555 [Caulobacteraceae bacterium]